MRKGLVIGLLAVMLLAGAVAITEAKQSKDDLSLQVKPFTFVGAADACGPGYPAGTPTVTAAWLPNKGLPDSPGEKDDDHGKANKSNINNTHPGFGLFLEKLGNTSNCAAAGADITGVKGINLTEIGWDVQDGGHCGAGAPRFNVVTTDNVTHFIGCSSPPPVTATPIAPNWTRMRYDPTTAFPPITPNETVSAISIIFDEGNDTGPDFTGHVFLDNIDVNGVLVGKPGKTDE